MKKVFVLVILIILTLYCVGQNHITTFLGIPVDGTKSEMIQKLKTKGFVSSTLDKEILKGEFNGRDVYVSIVTNNNKVFRIMLYDAISSNESQIRNRYNTLCQQFTDNERYYHQDNEESQELPEDENISYEIMVKKKQYQAHYYQLPSNTTSTEFSNEINTKLQADYKMYFTPEQLQNPNYIERAQMIEMANSYLKPLFNCMVWFTITGDDYGGYYIAMYYDNKYNEANGDDL